MKLASVHLKRRSQQSGMATIAVIAIVALLLVFVMGNVRSLNAMNRQLRLLEQTQRARINMQVVTNAPPASTDPAASTRTQ